MAEHWHRRLIEGKSGLMAALTTVLISVGGLVEIVPMFTLDSVPEADWIDPYTPLEVAGRDIYIREGCYTCHSQMVRPFRDETLRYGPWSHSSEYMWDRPFLLGSRRIGPDLHRIGGKYPDAWHYEHMKDPRATSPGSIMPPYQWLLEWKIDAADVQASVLALSRVGTPYSQEEIDGVPAQLQQQGGEIVERLKGSGIDASWDDEIVALTAYLQRLGTDRPSPVAQGGGE